MMTDFDFAGFLDTENQKNFAVSLIKLFDSFILEENEEKIIEELMALQGEGVDLGGYYHTDPIKVRKIMRPSKTFNQIIP